MTRLHPTQLRSIADQQRAGVPPHEVVVPAAPPKRKRDNEEWRIQSDFFRWWHSAAKEFGVWPGLCFHIPNGSMLGDDKQSRMIRARMLKLAGVVSGVPDVFLAVFKSGQPYLRDWSGLWIEFKVPKHRDAKNGGCSDAQQEYISYLVARGYAVQVCYSWEEGRDAVIQYLKK